MKFKLLLGLLVILLIIGCTQPSYLDSDKVEDGKIQDNKLPKYQENNFLIYEDSVYKVKISYPRTWKLVESKESIFAFQEPKLNDDDQVQENINLIMGDVTGQKVTFDTFKELALENLKKTVPDFSLVESSATVLAGGPAQKMVFTAFTPKHTLIQVITLKNDITYAITFISDPKDFDNYIGTVQQMLDSFEILGDVKDTGLKSVNTVIIKKELLVGTYRCWSYNVGGAGKSCTSPPIVLQKDGTYSMSSEKGTYLINKDKISLSESKIRGNGTILEQEKQIRFEYDYTNLHHVVTYLKADWDGAGVENKDDALAESYVEVSLNIIFPDSQSVSGINSVALVEKEGKKVEGKAIAYESKPHIVTALFRKLATKPGIPTGKVYVVQASSGFGYWDVGEIDLRSVTKDIELDIKAKIEPVSTTIDAAEQKIADPVQTEKKEIPMTGYKCDPNIPKYTQPGCVE